MNKMQKILPSLLRDQLRDVKKRYVNRTVHVADAGQHVKLCADGLVRLGFALQIV
ncbi:hypothetical protein SDC9_172460 [bioreactor metagenome]|uniref:Uncharacterized protein n=1 Tax=bioreactor metagenome TaxID=1076179 RepID=A0A645GMW7_9ZZZZ